MDLTVDSGKGVTRPTSGNLWSIILAGGEGRRLRPLIERIHHDARPKQFAILTGSRSLLGRTLDRSELLVPPERTVAVMTRSHAPFFSGELWGECPPRVLVQPSDRGTAAGVLLPAHRIARMDPKATVLVFPSDHYVADDAAFMGHVEAMADAARRHPARILLAGARPDTADAGYGWIRPGVAIETTPTGRLHRIDRFFEKPDPLTARELLAAGALWNTFVMACSVEALIDAGRRTLPLLHECLSRIDNSEGEGEGEGGESYDTSGIESAYCFAPTANFSQSVLAADTTRLAVSRLPDVGWSDWGTPDRVLDTLRRQGLTPEWTRRLAPTG